MAECRFCNKYIPDGVVQCPHCQASLQAAAEKGGTISPFEVRARALRERRQTPAKGAAGRLPASRLALFGCLGAIALLVIVAVVGVLVAPDKARTLMYGTPTSPPPTPRATSTPTPIPSPTPEWTNYQAPQSNFEVNLPPFWIVLDYADPNWELILEHKAHWYSWLLRELPEEKRQLEAETLGIRAFDPRRLGAFSVYCHPEPDLAGMSVRNIQSGVGQDLQEQGIEDIRSYQVEIDGRPAALFEFTSQLEEETPDAQVLKTELYILALEEGSYWIEVVGSETDLDRDARIVQAMINSFHIVTQGRQGD